MPLSGPANRHFILTPAARASRSSPASRKSARTPHAMPDIIPHFENDGLLVGSGLSVGVEADKAQKEKCQGADKNFFHVVRNFECCRKFVSVLEIDSTISK